MERMPICMGAGEHCLQQGAQAWLTILQTSEQNAGVGHLFLLSMEGFKNVTHFVRTCVRLPHIIMKGKVKWNKTLGYVSCKYCSFYTCINSSIPFTKSYESLYILRARTGVWMPVRLSRPWQDSPATMILQQLMDHVKRRAKRFFGMLIAAVLGIIALTAAAAVAGVALHQSVQTASHVRTWHRDAEQLWTSQRQIDSVLQSQVADLQQAVILLGDQIVSLEKRVQLKCDWNTTFCITPVLYNESMFKWDKVRQHILGYSNASGLIADLQTHIADTFQRQLPELQGIAGLQSIVNGIEDLHPILQIHGLFGSSIASWIVICLLLVFLCLVWKRLSRNQRLGETRAAVFSVMLNKIQPKEKGELYLPPHRTV
uniref:Retroviral envelope protein GP41-like domain-containing protein n=1 Tax=Rousettus aegyptiacus TaxID=9407 RepID=A0A7J8EKF9_ROUAE|nr:hypothetical protein HJG63_012535 [Rousettus aegyptiacus]